MFDWRWALAAVGLHVIGSPALLAVDYGSAYYVYSTIDPGTYSFVFWGGTTKRERREKYDADYALGVPFTSTGN